MQPTTIFAFLASLAVTATASSSPDSAPVLEKREVFSKIACFHSNDCSGGSDVLTVIDPSVPGKCLTLAGYKSAKTQQVKGGCSVTLYTDKTCTNNPTLARKDTCTKCGAAGDHVGNYRWSVW